MSAVLSSEGSAGGVLPVTGSGPFSMLLALIGLISVGIGSVLRRISGRAS